MFPDVRDGTSTSETKEVVGLESFLSGIVSHMVEKCVYRRAVEPPKIHMEEIPPIIAIRGYVVLNTEKEKQSAFLKKNEVPEGIAVPILFTILYET